MATKNSTALQAKKLVASLEAKIKKLQSQISQARNKAVANAKKALATASKAAQKGRKNTTKLNSKLKAAKASAKKAKTTAANKSAKKRINTAKTELTKQKVLITKLLNTLASAKTDLAVASKTKKDADTLEKAALKISRDHEKTSKKKVIKKTKPAPKTKSVTGKKVKNTAAKRPPEKRPESKAINKAVKKTKIATKQPDKNTLAVAPPAPAIESGVTAPKVETQIAASATPTSSPQLDNGPVFSPPIHSSDEEARTQEASPFLKTGDSLFD